MSVSSFSSAAKPGVCLSTDRPDSPFDGQVIYETDTNRTLVYDNSAWVVIHDPTLMSYSGTGVTVTADAATIGGENVTPYTGRRNLLYNGEMRVAQRGSSATGTTTPAYTTADRWRADITSAGTWTQTIEADAPSGFARSYKVTCTTAAASLASNSVFDFQQRLEGADLQGIGKGTADAKQLTLSFWVKSNVTGTYIAELYDNDNLRQISRSYTIDTADTWEKKTFVFDADTTGEFDYDVGLSLYVIIWIAAGSNFTSGTLNTAWGSAASNVNRVVGQVNAASAVNNYFQFTGVQLELGNKATPFEHRLYGEELALCQRYYWRHNRVTGYEALGAAGIVTSASSVGRLTVFMPTSMRISGGGGNLSYSGLVC